MRTVWRRLWRSHRQAFRDLVWLGLGALVVCILGFALDISGRVYAIFVELGAGKGEVGFVLGVLTIALAIFAVRRWLEVTHTEQEFRSMFENSPVGVFRSTPDGHFLMVNNALAVMLGYETPQQVIAALQDLSHQLYVNPERRISYLETMERDGAVYDFENQVYRRDGSKIWILGNGRAVRDARGKILYLEGNVQDITARKETEEAYRRLVDQSLQGTAILQHGRYVFANRAFGEMLGLTTDQITAMTAEQVIAVIQDEDRETMVARIRDRLQGKNVPARQVFQIRRKDGKARWVEAHVSRIEYQNAPAVFILAVDVTERKLAQDAMQDTIQRAHLREQVGTALARGGSDLHAITGNLARVLVSGIGDGCIVALVQDASSWSNVTAFAQSHPERHETLYQLVRGSQIPVHHPFWSRLLTQGEPILIEKLVPEEIQGLGLATYAEYIKRFQVSSLVVVAMRQAGKVLGIVGLTREDAGPAYTVDDQSLLQELADRAALAVANGQLVQRLSKELEARRDAEKKYRTLVEQIPAVTYIASLEHVGDTLYVSPQVQEMFGYTPEEWLSTGDFWSRRLHPDDRDWVLAYAAEKRQARAPFHAEYRLLARNGTAHWVRDQAVFVSDATGNPQYQHGIMFDITTSKTLEIKYTQALKQSDAERVALRRELDLERQITAHPEPGGQDTDPAHFQAAFAGTWDMLVVLDRDGTIRYVNDAVPALYGYKTEELVGTRFDGYIHPDDLPVLREQVERVLEQPDIVHRLSTIRTRTRWGEWRLTYATAVNRLDDPEIDALLFNFRDVTEQVLHEREHLRAEAAVGEQHAFAQALRDSAALLNSASDIEQVLDGILDTLARIVPYETASIFMQEGDSLRMARVRGFEKYRLEDWIRAVTFPVAMPKYQQLIAEATPVVIADTYNAEYWVRLPETDWIRSHLAVPVRIGNETVGMLGLDSATPNFYTSEHGARLLAFADLAGAAVRNARLLDETRHRAQEFRALYETISELTAPVETGPLLETVVARAVQLFDTPIGFLYAHQPDDHTLRLVVNHGLDPNGISTLEPGEGLVGQVALLRQPMYVNDYQHWEHRIAEPAPQATTAVLGVPIAYGGNLNGVLGVAETDPTRRFNEHQLSLLTLFAGQVSTALETARLLTETRKRAEQLSLLYDVGLTLNRVLDSQTQLEFLFKIAQRALGSENMAYFQYRPETDTVLYQNGVGLSPESVARLANDPSPVAEPHDTVGWVAHHRLPALIPDVRRDSRWNSENQEIRTAVAVPVEHEKELRGVLIAVRSVPVPFTPQDERLLILFANQIAAAMELTQLFQAQNQRQHELEILRQASLAFATTQERQALTTLILDYALRLVTADNALLFFFADDKLEFGGLLWNPRSEVKPTNWIPREGGFTHTVARMGQVIVVDKVNTHPLFATWQWGGAIVGLPLKGGGRVRAVLNVSYEEPHRFASEELRALELLADQAAVALENARNYEETQRQLRDAQILHRAGEALNRTLSFEQTLERLADFFMQALHVDMCSMSRFYPERDEIEILLDRDPLPTAVAVPGSKYRLSEYPYLVELLRDRNSHAMRRDDPSLSARNVEIMDTYYWKSVLALPLFVGDQVIGYVEVADQKECRDFSTEEIRLAESLAHQASSALQNARLFQETQRRADHLNVLNRIARRINGVSNVDGMLVMLESEISTVLPSDASFIALYDDSTGLVDFHRVVDYGVVRPSFQWSLGPSLTRQVIQSAHALLLDDRADYVSLDNPPQFYGDGSTLRAWLGVPIRSGDRVLGVISLQSKRRAAFEKDDEQLLQTIADQVAAAIERVLRPA